MKKLALITAFLLLTGFTAAQTSSNIDIELKNTEPTPLQTSEYADIWLEVRNTGTTAAENIDISFNQNYPFTVDRGDRQNWSIPELVSGDTYQLHLQVRVDSNALQGENTLNFDVDTPRLGFEEKISVEVRSDRNILSVETIEFPEKAAPGSANRMQLELHNPTSGQIKNIQINPETGADLPFATGQSSQKSIAQIESGSTETVNYTLNIDESAENGVYKLPIKLSFENEAGTEFSQSTTTGINIGGIPRLEAALNTDTTLTDGATEEITFRLVNRGYGSAEFVSMKLNETDNIDVVGNNEVYIGSMDSDDFQTASFRVNVDAETESLDIDTLDLPVVLEYTDSSGEQTKTQVVRTELYTQQQLQSYGLTSSGSMLPIIAVFVLAVGGIYYWRKRRNKE